VTGVGSDLRAGDNPSMSHRFHPQDPYVRANETYKDRGWQRPNLITGLNGW